MGELARCGARRTKHGGAPCQQPAGKGTDHRGYGRCHLHGGSTEGGRIEAARIKAAEHAVVMGVATPTAPEDALQLCVDVARAEVAYCSEQLTNLTEDEAVGPVTTVVERRGHGDDDSASYDQTTKGPPAAHIWIRLRAEALERLARFSKLMLDANVADRQTRVIEQHTAVIAEVFVRVFDEMSITPEQRRVGAAAVERHLEVVEGTATELAA